MIVPVLERARDLGFLGPGPVANHIEHAEQIQPLLSARFGVSPDFEALDLGSGGGLPGLVLALANPATRWVLLDANLRRTEYLVWAVSELGLGDRVEVLRARAEVAAADPQWRLRFDLVTARSFGPPAVTAESAVPFLRLGGYLMVSEPPEPDPNRWPEPSLGELGLTMEAGGTWAVMLQSKAAPSHLPRREGVAAKRPFW